MKWLKILLIPVVIIIVIIIALLLLKSNSKEEIIAPYIERAEEGTKYKTEIVITKMYYTITKCCDSIIQYAQKEDKVAIYSLLNNEYKTNNSISLNNVFEAINLNKIKKYNILKVYRASGERYARYFIQSITDIGYIYFNINVELGTSTYDFALIDEASYNEYIQMEVPIYSLNIAENVYNTLPKVKYADVKIASLHFYDFINNAIDFPEVAYNSLDKDYRESKFGNIQAFKNYVTNNEEWNNIYKYNKIVEANPNLADKYEKIGIKSQKKEKKDGYNEYIFTDTYGNVYTFKVTSYMQYSVILDK